MCSSVVVAEEGGLLGVGREGADGHRRRVDQRRLRAGHLDLQRERRCGGTDVEHGMRLQHPPPRVEPCPDDRRARRPGVESEPGRAATSCSGAPIVKK